MDTSKIETKPAFAYTETEDRTNTFTGGKPFINDNFKFPYDKDGNPLVFFCQVDLSEVDQRIINHLHLPESGFMQFYHGGDDLMGMDFDSDNYMDNSVSKILYLDKAFDEDFDMPKEYEEDMNDYSPLENSINRDNRRIFYKGEYIDMLPFPNSNDNPAITEKDSYGEEYMNYYEKSNEKYYELYLGGYPHFVQWDFRKEDSNISLLLGSESGNNIMWGDAGAGGFWVPQNNLEKQDYSESLIFWDCG